VPRDGIYPDLFADYLDLCRRYCETVTDLGVLLNEGEHRPFVMTALLARTLAAEVKAAREAIEAAAREGNSRPVHSFPIPIAKCKANLSSSSSGAASSSEYNRIF